MLRQNNLTFLCFVTRIDYLFTIIIYLLLSRTQCSISGRSTCYGNFWARWHVVLTIYESERLNAKLRWKKFS